MRRSLVNVLSGLLPIAPLACQTAEPDGADARWRTASAEQWASNVDSATAMKFDGGMAEPTARTATVRSVVRRFAEKRSASELVVEQSPVWQNWDAVPNLGPANLGDAPVMLSLGPNNYWMFGRYGGRPRDAKRAKGAKAKAQQAKATFEPKPARIEGFDMELTTTRFARQFDGPGGRDNYGPGYHAWQSRDMVHWVHHGRVTAEHAKWTTSAEFADGKLYIYYDFPNDQDPHVYVDDDLFDGQPGKDMGMAFDDPSHGSDCGVIRDLDGRFHIIYENWDPISANKRSWDSPLAGHTVSDDGLTFAEILAPAVDSRTEPTGEIGTYKHPHWVREDPARFKTNIAEYKIHSPEQEAYGDWAAISVGGRYYLFGDFDPVGGHAMSVGWFTSASLDEPFAWCDSIGKGHPDPDICFAEGRFYLATQLRTDYTSPGPWVETVEARVGVDTDNDGAMDQWTDWQAVKESYDYTPGFAKQVRKTPAKLNLSRLPAGYGFQWELRTTDTTENKSKPILDAVTLAF
ncbi:MAG: hypothetical protein AB8H80_00430 [Planctomycetota bacterium]